MKRKLNPNYPSIVVVITSLVMGLWLLMIGIYCVPVLHEGLITGRIYSMAVVFRAGSMVYRSSAPVEYWMTLGLYSIGCVGVIGLGISMSIEVVIDYIKKLGRQKKERDKQ